MSSTTISGVRACEILDSRGNPTVEAEVTLSGGACARAAAPSGASVGGREAAEKRDGGARYRGKGVLRAAAHISGDIAPALRGKDAADQATIDALLIALDGSGDKSRLGANAVLAVSLAVLKAAAKAAQTPLYQMLAGGEAAATLPVPMMNVINGGAHAGNNLDVQEFMIVPHGFDSFPEALRAGVETFHALRDLLADAGLSTAVGDEGGFAPDIGGTEAALALLTQAVETAGYRAGDDIGIALDCAAGELLRGGVYRLPADDFAGDAAALASLLAAWAARYPLVSIEDGCGDNDRAGWKILTAKLGDRLQLVGDDLFATNAAVLQDGIGDGIANALLVKPNQIGTVSETIAAARLAEQHGYATIMSHRSGDTEYADIADFAVGLNCRQIKTGAPCRGERTAKYNRLLRIAAALGDAAEYPAALYARAPA